MESIRETNVSSILIVDMIWAGASCSIINELNDEKERTGTGNWDSLTTEFHSTSHLRSLSMCTDCHCHSLHGLYIYTVVCSCSRLKVRLTQDKMERGIKDTEENSNEIDWEKSYRQINGGRARAARTRGLCALDFLNYKSVCGLLLWRERERTLFHFISREWKREPRPSSSVLSHSQKDESPPGKEGWCWCWLESSF